MQSAILQFNNSMGSFLFRLFSLVDHRSYIESYKRNDTQAQIRCNLSEIQGTYMIWGDGSRFGSITVGQKKYPDVRFDRLAKQRN